MRDNWRYLNKNKTVVQVGKKEMGGRGGVGVQLCLPSESDSVHLLKYTPKPFVAVLTSVNIH